MALAAVPFADLAAGVLLLLFVAWSAWRGALRALLSLGVLLLAFPLASRLGPRLEEAVVKVVSLPEVDGWAVAWAAAFAGVLLAGGVALALLQPFLARVRLFGAAERGVAGVLGLVRGAVVGTVLLYAVVLTDGGGRTAAALERSTAAKGARAVAATLRGVLPVPPWLDARLAEADTRIGPPR